MAIPITAVIVVAKCHNRALIFSLITSLKRATDIKSVGHKREQRTFDPVLILGYTSINYLTSTPVIENVLF